MNKTPPLPRLQVANIFWITVVHLLSIAALWFFTWKAFFLCVFLHFFMNSAAVTLTYHRMLSHKAFKTPKWLEYSLATLGVLSGQGPILIWVAEHRLHHRYSDTAQDPHNSLRGFFYAHIGHLFYHKDFEDQSEQWMKYVPDLSSQPFYVFLNRYNIIIALLGLPLLYLAGGLPFVMWGGFVRVVLMLHTTWFINSACHMWGYRNFETRDRSTNCWWAAFLAAGEGWHNNHHAQPSCAAHGRQWWEFDLTWVMIRSLEKMGLAWDIKKPTPINSSKNSNSLLNDSSDEIFSVETASV
jgi:stearoyl-CoA desaturase (delta-9 desaturase)